MPIITTDLRSERLIKDPIIDHRIAVFSHITYSKYSMSTIYTPHQCVSFLFQFPFAIENSLASWMVTVKLTTVYKAVTYLHIQLDAFVSRSGFDVVPEVRAGQEVRHKQHGASGGFSK